MFTNPLRSGKRSRNRRQRKATSSLRRFHNRSSRFETLEPRQMLTSIPSLSIGDVTVDVQEGSMEFIDAFVTNGTHLNDPSDIILGPDGNLYVSSTSTDSVLRYNSETGELLDEFVAPESGGLNGPESLAFGPDGNLYVNSSTPTRCCDITVRQGSSLMNS